MGNNMDYVAIKTNDVEKVMLKITECASGKCKKVTLSRKESRVAAILMALGMRQEIDTDDIDDDSEIGVVKS